MTRGSIVSTVRAGAALLFAAAAARAATPPQGFQETVVFAGLSSPTAVRFLPDGSVLVAEKSGLIKMFASLTATSPTIVADLRTQVHNFWDRGLLGMAVDPDYLNNGYIYVSYAYDAAIGGVAPRWGSPGVSGDGCPTPPGATTDGCVISGRVSRLQITNGVAGAEQVLIEDWCQQYPSHSIGTLAFGADGMLYVTGGEGASFVFADWGQGGGTSGSPPVIPANPCGDPPAGVGGSETPPSAEGGALRSQSVRRAAGEPVLLNGTLLRVDPSTGAAAPGNPLSSNPDPNARRIVGYGFRNPFRFTIKPGTNEVFVGDVGWNTYEEIDSVTNPLDPNVRNFGWPCYEGSGPQPGYQSANLALCSSLYSAGTATPPLYSYNHNASVVAGDGCTTGSSSISGLAFYPGGEYPTSYNNALFFADYSRKCIWVMFPDANGEPDPNNRVAWKSGAAGPVDLQAGPNGDIYYADLDGGTIRRFSYLGPTAVATASPNSGAPPLSVQFDGTASQPGQPGDTITYAWDLDGNGQFNDSTDPAPTWIYAAAGSYTARLKVTDNHGVATLSDPLVINVDTHAPTAFIDQPDGSLTWKVGDTISFSGHATDPQQGTLPPSALSWDVVIHHCPSNCHTHLYQSFAGVASGSFPAPDHDYPSYLEIRLTATDNSGLSSTASVNLDPQTVPLTFQTSPPGLQIGVGSTESTAPVTETVIIGSQNSVSAPSPQGAWTYASWSDGGAQSHNIVAPATATTYTANYTSSNGVPPGWLDQDIGSVGVAGTVAFGSGAFTVKGSGSDIAGNLDAFHYLYQSLSGDGMIVARVASVQNTNAWAKAGVMIRETTGNNAANAFAAITPSNGAIFQRRTTIGGGTTVSTGFTGTAPQWLRLIRAGNTITAYRSTDGVTWALLGSQTYTMGANVLVGLAVTSHSNTVLCSSVFDNVSITQGTVVPPPSVSLTSPAAGTSFTAPGPVSLSASASDVDGTITQVDFYAGNTLVGSSTSAPYTATWNNASAGSYALTARATDNSGNTTISLPVSVTVNSSSTGLPSPFTDQDIGAVGLTGSASASGSVFTVKGSGGDIWAASDAFHFVYQTVSGDTTVIARVASIQNTDPWAKAGVMIRDGVGVGATNAFMALTRANGLSFQRRTTVNGSTGSTSGGAAPIPYWVRLVRSGNLFTASSSSDGIGWNTVGSITINMGASVLVGLAVTSHNNSVLGTDTFDNVSVTGGVSNPPPTVSITNPANGAVFTAPATVTIDANASDTNGGSVVRVDFYNGSTLLGSDTTAPYEFIWNSVPAGSYTLTAQAVDDGNAVGTSAPVSITVNNPANNPPTVSITNPPNNASFTAPATVTIDANASDTDGTIQKVDFYNGSTLLGTDTTAPYEFVWNNVAAGSYTLTAKATDNGNAVTTSAPVSITVSNPSGGLPPPWTNQDVGSVGVAGTATFGSNAFTVKGSGADIAGVADAFQFVSQPLSGDGVIVARVASIQNTNAWAKAGIMVRESLAVGSANAFAGITPTNGAVFQRRTATNGGTVVATGFTAGLPQWLKLIRIGNTIQAYRSPDGVVWWTLGSATYTMGANVLVGLAVTSHANTVLCSSVFDNVTVTPGTVVPPPSASLTYPPPGASLTAPATIGLTADATDVDGHIVQVDFWSGTTTLIGSSFSAPWGFTWSSVPAGTYSLTARATDDSGNVTASLPVNITVNASGAGLPSPFRDQDIGAVGPTGSASASGSVFTVKGSGGDIWSTADAFHYVYQPVIGDTTIVARVTAIQNTDGWAKAGVMIRESVSAGAPNAFMAVSRANGLTFQRRSVANAATSSTAGGAGAAPYWVKIVRAGNLFTASVSADNVTWNTVASVTITMNSNVLVGLAVTSHNNSALGSDTFDNVTVTAAQRPR